MWKALKFTCSGFVLFSKEVFWHCLLVKPAKNFAKSKFSSYCTVTGTYVVKSSLVLISGFCEIRIQIMSENWAKVVKEPR